MDYKSIQNIHLDFSNAVSATLGLNQFYMIYESEINKIKNYNYPVCIVEPPNSKVSDINRAYEEYDMVCFVLKPESRNQDDYSSLSLYDECMNLFKEMISEVLAEKNGEYILDEDSLDVERIKSFGNDKCKGVKVSFTILAPSSLGFTITPELKPSLPDEENLISFYSLPHSINHTGSAIYWNPIKPTNAVNKTITETDNSQIVPLSNNLFNFTNPNTFTSSESLKLTNTSFSSASFTVFAKLFISDEAASDLLTLFSFSKDAENDYYTVQVIVGGGNEGGLQFLIDDDTSAETITLTNIDLRPYGDSSSLRNIAIVNDHVNGKTVIYTDTNQAGVLVAREFSNYRDDTILNSDFIFGATQLGNTNNHYRGFVGKLKSLAIYDEACSSSKVNDIIEKFKTL